MTTTIARQARIRFANETAPLAQLVINARFATIVDELIAEIEADAVEFEFDCQVCGDGAHEVFSRMAEDCEPVEACERCVDTYHLGYVAD